MSDIEAMKLALWHEAMAKEPKRNQAKREKHEATAKFIRQAIAEAEAESLQQEPVGEMQLSAVIEGMVVPVVPVELPVGTKLYTHPQPEPAIDNQDLTIAYMSGVYDGKKNYKNSLVKQARYVRNYSNTEEYFEAVPLSFILEDYDHGMEAAHGIKEET